MGTMFSISGISIYNNKDIHMYYKKIQSYKKINSFKYFKICTCKCTNVQVILKCTM